MSKFGKYAPNVFLAVSLAAVSLALVVLVVFPSVLPPDEDVMERAGRFQRFAHILTEQLTVLNDTEFRGDVAQEGDQTITGDFTVTDNTTFGDAADDTMTASGDLDQHRKASCCRT